MCIMRGIIGSSHVLVRGRHSWRAAYCPHRFGKGNNDGDRPKSAHVCLAVATVPLNY